MVHTIENKNAISHENTTIDELLSQEVLLISAKIDRHLNELQKTIEKWETSENISQEHTKLMDELSIVISKVQSEYDLSTEARTAFHSLSYRLSIDPKDIPETKFNDLLGKAADFSSKHKIPAAIIAWSAATIMSIKKNVKKKKTLLWKAGARIWGFFNGFVWWSVTYLIGYGIEASQKIIDWLNPQIRAWKAKESMKELVDKLKIKIWMKEWEKYDPENQKVAEARENSTLWENEDGLDIYEWATIYMDEVNRPVFGLRNGKTQIATYSNDIKTIHPKLIGPRIDSIYTNPTFTDQTKLTIDFANMRVQAAHKRDQEWGIFENKNTGIASIHLIEQDIYNLQQTISKEPSPWLDEIKTIQQAILNQIATFEKQEKWVFGNETYKDILPLINDYNIPHIEQREKLYTQTKLKIYNASRKTWWITYWDSDIVKQHLTQDLLETKKYTWLDEIFENEDPDIWDILSKIWPNEENDAEVSKIITNHFKQKKLLASDTHQWIAHSQIQKIVQSIIHTYHNSKKNIKTAEPQFRKHLTRAYGLEIESNESQQAKMVAAYEQMYTSANLAAYAKSKNISYTTTTDKRKAVRDFAWDVLKKNALHWAVISTYHDMFFDLYLPTQKNTIFQEAARLTWEWRIIEKSTLNQTEELLANITWAWTYIADSTTNTAINAGINIAISLIPVMWVELTVTRIWASMALAWTRGIIARAWMRALLWHTAMTGYTTMISDQSVYEWFGDFTDRRKFGQNALYFSVVWRIWWMIGKQVWKITPSLSANSGKLASITWVFLQSLSTRLGQASTETGIIQLGSSFFDPNFERNRWEVMTIYMLSLVMSNKIWYDRMKNLQATKWPHGKVSLQPKVTTNTKQKIRKKDKGKINQKTKKDVYTSQTSMTLAQIDDTFVSQLRSLKEWEHIIMYGQLVEAGISGAYKIKTATGSKTYPSINAVINQAKIQWKYTRATTKMQSMRKQDLLWNHIELSIRRKATFKIWNQEYIVKTSKDGRKQIFKKWSISPISTTDMRTILENSFTSSIYKIGQKLQSKQLMNTLLSKATKLSWKALKNLWAKCKQWWIDIALATGKSIEKITVWDLFALMSNKKYARLMLGKRSWTHKYINIASLMIAASGWDHWDDSWSEVAENYLLYVVLWRALPIKILLGVLDGSDTFV